MLKAYLSMKGYTIAFLSSRTTCAVILEKIEKQWCSHSGEVDVGNLQLSLENRTRRALVTDRSPCYLYAANYPKLSPIFRMLIFTPVVYLNVRNPHKPSAVAPFHMFLLTVYTSGVVTAHSLCRFLTDS